MKLDLNFRKLAPYTLLAAFVLTTSCKSTAQTKTTSDVNHFKVVVEHTNTGIKMQSVEGGAGTYLSFSLAENEKQAIDHLGMTKLN